MTLKGDLSFQIDRLRGSLAIEVRGGNNDGVMLEAGYGVCLEGPDAHGRSAKLRWGDFGPSGAVFARRRPRGRLDTTIPSFLIQQIHHLVANSKAGGNPGLLLVGDEPDGDFVVARPGKGSGFKGGRALGL